MGCYATE